MATNVAALLEELKNRREFRWNVPDWIDLDGLIAALERAERVEAALLELATEISRSLQVDQPPGRNQLGAWLALAALEGGDG